jgi:hypothetical protein
MNERIKALLLNARNMFDNGVTDSNNKIYIHGSEENLEKFAELIVQECVHACINEGKTYEVKSAGEYASNLYVTAIKKHFGVEEQVTESNEWHTCPYAEEIHGDYETLCDCDEEQAYQCRMDI